MKPSDRKEFGQLIADAMGYYRQDVSPFTLNLWWQACKGFDLEQVSQALTAHAMDPERGKFPVMVSDVVRYLSGTSTERAALAWGKAHAASSDIGAYTDVVFDDPAIHAAIEDLGGWVKFCRTETKDLSYLQHRFTESYRAYVARGRFEYLPVLVGASGNRDMWAQRGLQPPEPTLIGNQAQAKLVLANGVTHRSVGKELIDAVAMRTLAMTQPRGNA